LLDVYTQDIDFKDKLRKLSITSFLC